MTKTVNGTVGVSVRMLNVLAEVGVEVMTKQEPPGVWKRGNSCAGALLKLGRLRGGDAYIGGGFVAQSCRASVSQSIFIAGSGIGTIRFWEWMNHDKGYCISKGWCTKGVRGTFEEWEGRLTDHLDSSLSLKDFNWDVQ